MCNRVEEFRDNFGYRQIDLSEIVGISRSMLSHIENNKCIPNFKTAINIAHALHTTVEELFLVEDINEVRHTFERKTRSGEKANAQNRIISCRLPLDLSQHSLAEIAGVTRQAIGYIENGERIPNVVTAIHISRALNTTVEELFIV
jgi:putative transcriptional regulator